MNLGNPFQALYVTEYIQSSEFPKLFSPVLVPHLQALFEPGNLVLRGTQGTGKSMLLSLLDSTVRAEYHLQKLPSPVPTRLQNFVCASINLSSSNATKLNERRFSESDREDESIARAVFADFINYWIVRDLFRSLNQLGEAGAGVISQEQSKETRERQLNVAAGQLAAHPAWFGALKHVTTITGLDDALSLRLKAYFSFLNFNTDSIPLNVAETKTTAGEPINAAVRILRATRLILPETQVFVVVDQFEELQRLEESEDGRQYHQRFRGVIHHLLSSRDRTVSYRIGTRPSAMRSWRPEMLRDYIQIDLDETLQRGEHIKSHLFRSFAEDVLARRVIWKGYTLPKSKRLLRHIFGNSPTPTGRAEQCVRHDRAKVLNLPSDWPGPLVQSLRHIASEDVLTAKLGEAWYRQHPDETTGDAIATASTTRSSVPPWMRSSALYWRKDRFGQAVLQIAVANAQRVPIYGDDDIIKLSGSSILVFASICQHIWDTWSRTASCRTNRFGSN